MTQKNAPVVDVAGADRQALTITEAAVRLNKSVSTVNNLIKSGGFPNSFLQVSGQRRRRMIPIADLDNLIVRTGSGGGKKGCLRGTEPNAAAIEGRGAYARAKMKRLHGYGKREISEMIALGKNGLTLEEIAVRFRLDKGIIADLLAQAAGREMLKHQKLALKPSRRKLPSKSQHSPHKLKKLPGKALLLELYGDARLPKKAILSKLKINDTTLYNALLRYGIPLRSVRSRQRSEEREQMLRQMFLTEKLPLQTIADQLGLSLNRVRKSLRFLRNDDGTPLR